MARTKQFTSTTKPTEYLGDPQKFLIPREGDRDLAFTGWRLSRIEECRDDYEYTGGQRYNFQRCVAVSVYLTKNDNVVIDIERFKRAGDDVEGQEHTVQSFYAHAVDLGGDVVEWLKKDNRGRLGETSKRAWVEACEAWPKLSDEAVERV